MHAEFRPLLIAYAVFAVLQFTSGFWLYVVKAGPSAADAYEYYRGSDAAAAAFPERPAGFAAAKTYTGILKTQAPHSIAFSLVFFVLAHLTRSLGGSHGAVRAGLAAYASAALIDFLLPFALVSGPDFLLWLRFPVLAVYTLCGISTSLFLCVQSFRSSSS